MMGPVEMKAAPVILLSRSDSDTAELSHVLFHVKELGWLWTRRWRETIVGFLQD
jgi:hypothetical protein